MLKILFWLAWDVFLTYALIAFWSELGNYIYLFIAFIAFFTYCLIQAVKEWLGK